MKSKIDIIIETVLQYNSTNRATNDSDSCTYLSKDGNMCAVGRCLSDEGMCVMKKFENSNAVLDTSINYFIKLHGENDFDKCLKEEYRGHDARFWNDLQNLHDSPSNWSMDGITNIGLYFIGHRFGFDTLSMVKEALAR